MKKRLRCSILLTLGCLLLSVGALWAQDDLPDLPQDAASPISAKRAEAAVQAMKFYKHLRSTIDELEFTQNFTLEIYGYLNGEDFFVKRLESSTLADMSRYKSDGPRVRIYLEWKEEGGQYSVKPMAMVNSEMSKLYSNEALDAFLTSITGYAESVSSIKDSKVDEKVVEEVRKLTGAATPSATALTFDVDNIKKAAKAGITNANAYRGNVTESACNLCVRAAIWDVAISSVLFPNQGAFIGGKDVSSYLYGRVFEFDAKNPGKKENIGNANSIASSLEQTSKIPEFIKVPNIIGSTMPDFKQMQEGANNGQIIVGALKNETGSGHIMMIVPGNSDLSKSGNFYAYRTLPAQKELVLMPKILECRQGRRQEAHSLQDGVRASDIPNIKWYKMVGTYSDHRSKIK